MTYGSSVLHRVLLNGVHLFIRAYFGVEDVYKGLLWGCGKFRVYGLGAEVLRC